MSKYLKDHIEKLNIFVEIARAKSLHKAANHLRISQPALSQNIKVLEETLETPLFIRSKKGVELTNAGTKLLQFGERLQSEVAGIENQIRNPENIMSGSLKLGTFATLTSYLIPKYLNHMSNKFPLLTIGIATLKANELAEAILSKRCNLVVGTTKMPQKTITQIELYKDSFECFVSTEYLPTFKRHEITGNLKNAPLIYVPNAQDGKGKSIEKHLKGASVKNIHQYDVDNFDSVRSLVCEGLGIGILPTRLAEPLVQTGKLCSVEIPGLGNKFGSHQFYCSVLSQQLTDSRVSTVINELSYWCKKL